jgi:hypothetical protein
LKKEFNARKSLEFPWTYEVTKYASQQPFLHLQAAFRRFFDKKGRYPRFKRKGVHDSFYIGGDHLEVNGKSIRIPRLGWVGMREEVRFRGKVVSATVSRIADRWFVSVHVELEEAPAPCESQAGVGVDLGVNRLATLSNGERFEGPKPLRKELSKLRRLMMLRFSGLRCRWRMSFTCGASRAPAICREYTELSAEPALPTSRLPTLGSQAVRVSTVQCQVKVLAQCAREMGFRSERKSWFATRLTGRHDVVGGVETSSRRRTASSRPALKDGKPDSVGLPRAESCSGTGGYGGKFIRRRRSLKRVSFRRGSKSGSALMVIMNGLR